MKSITNECLAVLTLGRVSVFFFFFLLLIFDTSNIFLLASEDNKQFSLVNILYSSSFYFSRMNMIYGYSIYEAFWSNVFVYSGESKELRGTWRRQGMWLVMRKSQAQGMPHQHSYRNFLSSIERGWWEGPFIYSAK